MFSFLSSVIPFAYKGLCWLLDWSMTFPPIKDNAVIFAPNATLWDLTYFFIQWNASSKNKNLVLISSFDTIKINFDPKYEDTVTVFLDFPFAGLALSPRKKIDYIMIANYNPDVRSMIVGTNQDISQGLARPSRQSIFGIYARMDLVRLVSVCCAIRALPDVATFAVYLSCSRTSFATLFWAFVLSFFDARYGALTVWCAICLALRCASYLKYNKAMFVGLGCMVGCLYFNFVILPV